MKWGGDVGIKLREIKFIFFLLKTSSPYITPNLISSTKSDLNDSRDLTASVGRGISDTACQLETITPQ